MSEELITSIDLKFPFRFFIAFGVSKMLSIKADLAR